MSKTFILQIGRYMGVGDFPVLMVLHVFLQADKRVIYHFIKLSPQTF